MKKYLLSFAFCVVAAASSSAFAANACTGTAGNADADVPGETDGSTFVRVAFRPKCSANVLSQYEDQQTTFAVAAGSTKGKNVFIGNTAGGAIKPDPTAACPASGCTDTEVGTGLDTAKDMASS